MSPRSSDSPFGGAVLPRRVLSDAAARLAEWYEPAGEASDREIRLEPARAASLPAATIALEPERRLFSRTRQLVVTAEVTGEGPAADAALRLRARRVLRRGTLEWEPPAPSDDERWRRAFEDAGLIGGARTMTSIRELRLAWSEPDRRWTLRLATLAGAMIGTAPGSFIAVPFEPEDVDGLVRILRAFAAATRAA